MITKGISRDQVIRAIKWGAKIKQTDGLLASYSYIKVAYKQMDDLYVVKTVMVVK